MIYILIRGRRMWVLHKFLCNKEFQVICLIIVVSKFWKVQVSRGLFWDILRKLNEVVLVHCWWRELILWVLFCKAIASLSVTLSILNAPTASVSAVSLWWAGSDKLQAKKKKTTKKNRDGWITQMTALAQDVDVSVPWSCGEGRSEESLCWPADKTHTLPQMSLYQKNQPNKHHKNLPPRGKKKREKKPPNRPRKANNHKPHPKPQINF